MATPTQLQHNPSIWEKQYQREIEDFPTLTQHLKSKAWGAIFNFDQTHRYILWRTWDKSLAKIVFIGVNPSKANGVNNDPTTSKCIGFAKQEGYGGVIMVNLLSVISTDPKLLTLMNRGTLNTPNSDYWLGVALSMSREVIFMWGNNGEDYKNRIHQVEEMSGDNRVYCLGKTQSGMPRHIVRLPYKTKLERWLI